MFEENDLNPKSQFEVFKMCFLYKKKLNAI